MIWRRREPTGVERTILHLLGRQGAIGQVIVKTTR